MENNEVNEDLTTDQSTISSERKMILIDLMFRKSTNATFLSNRDGIKLFPMITEEEKAFVDEVYKKIKELNIGEDVFQLTNKQQLVEELYARCQIPREAVEEVRQKRTEKAKETFDKIAKEKERLEARMAADKHEEGAVVKEQQVPDLKVVEGIEVNEQVGYKEELYQPETLCGRSRELMDQPFVEHISYLPERIENISPQTSYQFADRTYRIKKVGSLVYMSAPNLQDSISEYEITISRDDISKTIRRFGEISFYKMNDIDYSTAVFLGLLGEANLTDKELHVYIGSLEKVQGENGELKNQYRMVHSPEEYTAVAIWEQIEKTREESKQKNQGKSVQDGRRAAGGDER